MKKLIIRGLKLIHGGAYDPPNGKFADFCEQQFIQPKI